MTRPLETPVQQAILAAIRACVRPVDVRAIPNGGKRTRWQAMQAKREGMEPGTPDLFVSWPGGCGWIEVKRPAARGGHRESDVSDAQRELIDMWRAWGHNVAICTSPESALDCLRLWGAPVVGKLV
jgi:hypothetical protein